VALLLVLAVVAPVAGAVAGTVVPARAIVALRIAALVAAASWFALLVDGGLVSAGRLHSIPLIAAAGCGAALVAAAVDASTLARPAWAGVALAAASVALAAGRTGTDGAGAVAALAVAVAAAAIAGRPSVRVSGTAGVGLVVAAAGVVALRSAANSWQLPLTDATTSHRSVGVLIVAGAVLLVLAGCQRTRGPAAVLVPAGAFVAAQAAPIVHRADGLAPLAVGLGLLAAATALAARGGRPLVHRPAAALTVFALAALIAPGATRGPGLLLAAAGTLALALEAPAAAAFGVPGGVALAIALATRGGVTSFVVGVLAGFVALALAGAAAREGAVPRPPIWTAPVLVLGAWLLVAPGTWGWVGPVSLQAYDVGAARALAGAALCVVTLVLLGRDPAGWYARAFPPDSPGEDAVRH
jgi:hypothetical protein